MSDYTTFTVTENLRSNGITFDDLRAAVRYMDFLEQQGTVFAELHARTYGWAGSLVNVAELMSVNGHLPNYGRPCGTCNGTTGGTCEECFAW